MNRFADWLATAQPGSSFVYYTGNLGEDRARAAKKFAPKKLAAPQALRDAQQAWNAYSEGLVHLTQRRLGDNLFAYIATRASEKNTGRERKALTRPAEASIYHTARRGRVMAFPPLCGELGPVV